MNDTDVNLHFRPWRHYIFMALISLATVFFAIGSTLLILQMWNYPPAYIALNVPPTKGASNDAHYARQISKDMIVIGREFQITREVRLRINREIVMNLPKEVVAPRTGESYQVMLRKELESTHVTYHPGFYKTERELALPYLPPGEYKIVNVICWSVNILREDCADLPDVSVKITDGWK